MQFFLSRHPLPRPRRRRFFSIAPPLAEAVAQCACFYRAAPSGDSCAMGRTVLVLVVGPY